MTVTLTNSILSASMQTAINEMRSDISDTSQEAVTGFYTDLTLKLDGDIGQAQLVQKALNDIEHDRELLTIRQTRVSIGQQQLLNVASVASQSANETRIALSMENSFSLEVAAQDAESALETIFSSLSVRVGQRFIFSGDATDQPPLGEVSTLLSDIQTIAQTAVDETDFETQLDTYFNDPAGGWQSSIYQGSANNSDTDTITATDDSITQLVRGLSVLALAQPGYAASLVTDTDTLLNNAADRIDAGQTALTLTQANFGRIDSRITGQLEDLDRETTIMTVNFTEIAVRDQYEAASELQLLEANLQAAYLLTSRLSELSILNYIR